MEPARKKRKLTPSPDESIPGGKAAAAIQPQPDYMGESLQLFEESSVTPAPSSSDPDSLSERDDDEDECRMGDVKLQGLINSVFQNGEILEHLFCLCPPELLVNFRLVSRLWHKESLATFRSSVLVKLKDDDKLERFLEFAKDTSNACHSKPFRRFKLEQWNFDYNHDDDDDDDDGEWNAKKYFLQFCASSITDLELDQCYCDEDDVKGFRKVIFTSFPNLQTLVLGFEILYSELEPVQQDLEVFYENQPNLKSLTVVLGCENRLPVSWVELLSRFCNLTSLQVKSTDEEDAYEDFEGMQLEEMLSAMEIIRRKDKSKLALKHLNILDASRESPIELSPRIGLFFRELVLPLQSLALDFGNATGLDIVQNILEVHGKTLKSLTARRHIRAHHYCGDDSRLLGEQLGNLEELRISENFFENLEFREIIYKYCPNLQTLNLDDHSLTIENGSVMEMDPFLMEHPNIKSLVVYLNSQNEDPFPMSWTHLLSQFSSLTSLTLRSESDEDIKDEDGAVLDILTAIQTVRGGDSRKLQLKHLDISALRLSNDEHGVLFPTISVLLGEIQLPLEYLGMHFGDWVESDAAREILEVHGKTLKSLSASTRIRPNAAFSTGRPIDNVQELRLFDNFFANLTFRNIVYECCPNLQTLEVDGCYLHNESGPVMQVDPYFMEHIAINSLAINIIYWHPICVPWVELLFRFPNLTNLKLVNLGYKESAGRVMAEILAAIQTIRETDKRKLQLKNLGLIGVSGLPKCDLVVTAGLLLRELQLPLDSLAMDFRGWKQPGLIQEILQTYGKSLKTLTACRNPRSFVYQTSEPKQLNSLEELTISEKFFQNMEFHQIVYECCPNLETLVVDDCRLDRVGLAVQRQTPEHGSFYYWELRNIKRLTVEILEKSPVMESWLEVLSHFPNLTSLKLHPPNSMNENASNVIAEMLGAVQIIPMSMTNLTELLLSQPIGTADLLQLREWIPNLRKLSMHLDDQQFRIVCQGWRNLRHLKVFGFKLTDEGVTGMKSFSPQSQPNITWLKNLKSFEMNDEENHPENLVTDVSAFHGFLQLDSLQSLKLHCQMSKMVKLGLKQKLQDCTIIDAVIIGK